MTLRQNNVILKETGQKGERAFVSVESETQNLSSKNLPRNRQIMLRFVEGQSVEAIAEYFELQPSTINGILNSPLVRQEMEKLTHSSVERITNLADEAVDLVRDTMRGSVGSELRFKAATRILDYNPELNPKKSEARDLVEGLGEGMIRAIGRQLREMEKPNEIPTDNSPGTVLDRGSDNGEPG